MIILKSLFIAFPQIIKIYVDISLKNKKFFTGYSFQKENYICKYIDVSPIEGELSIMRSVINLNKPKRESDIIIENYTNKLNKYLHEVAEFLIVMFVKDRIVRAEIKLFNVSLKFLVSLCKLLQTFFIKNEFIVTLSGFLNYSLNVFASPLGNELKLKNLNDYNFNPKFILGALLSVYSAFYDKIEFLEVVVKDERSYKYANFSRAKRLVENTGKIEIENSDFNNFLKFVDKLKEEERKIKEQEINYDDAPEEFCDALTALLMTDPVKLPKSNVILDRKTIETHLLSDQTDPFNRSPLSKDMLIPCPELKAKIEEYINKKKEERKKQMDIEK